MHSPADETAAYIRNLIRQDEIDRYLDNGQDFIDETAIEQTLVQQRKPDAGRVREILARSLAIETLTPEETATLLNVEDTELLEEMRQTGLAVKHKVHRRAVRAALRDATPPPRKVPVRVSPSLGEHVGTVREWLTADLSAPRKQRHTGSSQLGV